MQEVHGAAAAEKDAHITKLTQDVLKHFKQVEERHRALEWIAEKKRQDNDRHSKELEWAKSSRSCDSEVQTLKGHVRELEDKLFRAESRQLRARGGRRGEGVGAAAAASG